MLLWTDRGQRREGGVLVSGGLGCLIVWRIIHGALLDLFWSGLGTLDSIMKAKHCRRGRNPGVIKKDCS